jgi:hypothetical protein
MRCYLLESELENLKGTGYDKNPVSRKTPPYPLGYNCIAFAAGIDCGTGQGEYRPWWPHPTKFLFYWPPHLPREPVGAETLQNFIRAFEWKGYKLCENGVHEAGVEKVVIFLKNNIPTHSARQLESGIWTSKCGRLQDIQHDNTYRY